MALLGILFAFTPLSAELEARYGRDFFFKLRGSREAPREVVIVSLDKKSALKLKQSTFSVQSSNLVQGEEPDTWSRLGHARLLETLSLRGATIVVFDLYFYKPRLGSNEDLVFAQSMQDAGNVILGEWLDPHSESEIQSGSAESAPSIQVQRRLPPIPLLQRAALASAPFPLPKHGAVRAFWTVKPEVIERVTLPFMALQAYTLRVYPEYLSLLKAVDMKWASTLPQDWAEIESGNRLRSFIETLWRRFKQDEKVLPQLLETLHNGIGKDFNPQTRKKLQAALKSFEGTSRIFNFYGGPNTITNVPYYQLLDDTESLEDPIDFKNKVVFVGMMENLGTEKDTIEMVFSSGKTGEYFGVEAAATAFSNLLSENFIRLLSPLSLVLMLLFWGLVLGLLFEKKSPLVALAVIGAGYIIYGTMAYTLFSTANLALPLVTPLFQIVMAYSLVLTQRDLVTTPKLAVLNRSMKKLLPQSQSQDILEGKAEIIPGGKVVEATLVNTDLSGFTEIGAQLSPRAFHERINAYFGEIHHIVAEHDGIVTDVAGDAMFAIWEHKNSVNSAHQQALLAALAIADPKRAQKIDQQPFRTRLGLHTGPVSLGFVGSNIRCDFRQVSNTGNITERIQQFNKTLKTQILASETYIREHPSTLARKIGPVLLKGIKQPIILYEIMGGSEPARSEITQQISQFSAVLGYFEEKEWLRAQDEVKALLQKYPQDGPALYYKAWIASYLAQAPREGIDHCVLKEGFDFEH